MTEEYSLNKIIDYVQKLEKRVKKLESKDSIIIQNKSQIKNLKPIYISETKLIIIYNNFPEILEEYAVPVSIQGDSYRQLSSSKITFKKSLTGYYWVILVEEDHSKNYYLIPNPKRSFKFNKIETIKNLFFLTGNDGLISNNNFILEKPSILSILPSGLEWNLVKKGTLHIGKESKADKLMKELEIIVKQDKDFPKDLNRLIEILEEVNQNNSEIKQELNVLRKRISQTQLKYIDLVDLYNNNISEFKILTKNDKKMKVTDNAQNTILQGLTQPVSLECSTHGEYILKKIDNSYYLFPDPSIIFSRISLDIINQGGLFSIKGEIPLAILGKDIKLEKPAQLQQQYDIHDLWAVVKPGELDLSIIF